MASKLTGPCVLCSESNSSKTFLDLETLKTRNSGVVFAFKLFDLTGLQIQNGRVGPKKELCRICHDFVQEIDSIETNLGTKKAAFRKRIGLKDDPAQKTTANTATPSKATPKKAISSSSGEAVKKTPTISSSKSPGPASARKSKPMPLSKKRDSGIHEATPNPSPDVSMDESASCYIKSKSDDFEDDNENDDEEEVGGKRRSSKSQDEDDERKTTPGPKSKKRRSSGAVESGGNKAKVETKTPIKSSGKTPQKPLPKPGDSDFGPFVSTDEMPIMNSIYKENPELNFIVTRMTERIIEKVIGKSKDDINDDPSIKDLDLANRDSENPLNGTEWSHILRLLIQEATNDPKHTTLFQDKVFVKAFQAETRIHLVNKFPDFAYKGCLGFYRDDSTRTWNNEKVFENLRSKLNITVNSVRKKAESAQ